MLALYGGYAAALLHVAVAEHLGARRAEEAGGGGALPFPYAAHFGHAAAAEHSPSAAEHWAARGADRSRAGAARPLHRAARFGHVEVAGHLAAWGAAENCRGEGARGGMPSADRMPAELRGAWG